MSDPLNEMRRAYRDIQRPLFDRIAIHDDRVLHEIPRGTVGDSIKRLFEPRLYGLPVVVDAGVEVGVIELRLDNKVHKRFLLAELRA